MRFRLIAYEPARYALWYPTATELRRFSIKKIEDTVQRRVLEMSDENNRTAFYVQIYCGITLFQNNFSVSPMRSH